MLVSRRDALRSLAGVGAGTLTGTAVHGSAYAPHQLQVVRTTVAVPGLPAAFDGFRIGLITDLHHSAAVPAADIRTAVNHLVAAAPDLIALGGDYVTQLDPHYARPCAELLAELHAPHGVFAVLGNHDDDRAVPAAFRAHGIALLREEWTRIRVGSDAIDLAGIGYWTRHPVAIARALRGTAGPVVLLAHDPRRLAAAAALNVGVQLSGHTHGGQVLLPGLGAVAGRRFPVLAGRRFPVLAGTARRGGTTLFVSRGVGTSVIPYRLNCPPDVAVLTLTGTAPA